MDRHLRQIGEDDHLLVAAVRTAAHLQPHRRETLLKIRHLDEEIGALDRESLLADHVIEPKAVGPAVDDEHQLPLFAVADRGVGQASEE